MPAKKYRRWSTIVGLSLLLINTGCTTALKRAYYEIRGAKGEVKPVAPLSDAQRTEYRGVEFKPVHTTLSPSLCPPAVRIAFDRAAREMTRALDRRFPGGAPVLSVDPEIVYYQEKGLLGQAHLILRARLNNDNAAVADLLVVVVSESFREGDSEALTEEAAEVIVRYIWPELDEDDAAREDEEAEERSADEQ